MRKLINKKGFSLVELMIVVVIMGILIAVAIPLYNAVTDNAEANTCGSNQRLIRGSFANWVVMENDNTAYKVFKDGKTSYNGKTDIDDTEVFTEEFLERFDDKHFPACPSEGCYYTVSVVDATTLLIECHNEDGSVNTKHENKE